MATTETQNGFIVDASVEIGNVEHTQLQSIIKRVEQSYDTEVERVLADTAYTNGENLQFAEQAGIDLVGPIAFEAILLPQKHAKFEIMRAKH